MVQEPRLTDLQVEEYLKRINFLKQPCASGEVLDELIYLHQCTVPFETVDMYLCTTPPDLSLEAVYDKVVTRRRGGYCFELNFLFTILLKSLGFNVRPLICRVIFGRDFRIPVSHRGILVELDGVQRYADVGFGGPAAAGQVYLEEGVIQNVRGEVFEAKKINPSWWSISRETQGEADLYDNVGEKRFQTIIEVCMAEFEEVDFEPLNLFSARPGAKFHDNIIVNLRTETGSYSVTNDEFTIRENGSKEKRQITDKADFDQIIEKYFGFKP